MSARISAEEVRRRFAEVIEERERYRGEADHLAASLHDVSLELVAMRRRCAQQRGELEALKTRLAHKDNVFTGIRGIENVGAGA